ncbi:MAG: selenide, water dikinase SelD [Pseudomonadota bacterium]
MTARPIPLTRDLVLIGGGHAHALVLKRWGMNPVPGARLTLINPAPTAPYTGMLPGFVAGHYTRASLEIDLVRLARFAGARLILGAADAIDPKRGRIHVVGRGEIAYDLASVDVGITSAMPDLPGFTAHGVPAKPLGAFADSWSAYLAEDGPADIAVIGGGVGGAELAMAMAHALKERARTAVINLIEAGTPLPGVTSTSRAIILGKLGDLGVTLRTGAQVTALTAQGVTLEGGEHIAARLVVGAAGARPWSWLAETGLAHSNGFLDVDKRLRTSDPNIFAAGDCANLTFAPRPKAGVYAVRAAPILEHNLRATLAGSALREFRPQGDFLKLISLGGQQAVGEKWGVTLEGDWLWRQKDRIDRRFMDRLAAFPKMPLPHPPKGAAKGVVAELRAKSPPCAGCGAKVGPETLQAALNNTRLPTRTDVDRLPGDDGALISMGEQSQVISTDHLRAITDDPHLFARIAAVNALGDIWAMGAMPQAALASVILPPMSAELQGRWLEEIMSAAAEVFELAGAAVAGGHTSLGTEFTIGYTVTGTLDRGPITRSRAKPGDALILTRPLGSGVILAADMALKAPGQIVAEMLATMATPQDLAAKALKRAHAMTDVTGFGLAGHLLGLCQASKLGAEISFPDVPVYEGAFALAAKGIQSTLAPENEAAVRPHISLPDDPSVALLFDPQTAGGLLAALPEAEAEAALAVLRERGVPAARIGTLHEGPSVIKVRS